MQYRAYGSESEREEKKRKKERKMNSVMKS